MQLLGSIDNNTSPGTEIAADGDHAKLHMLLQGLGRQPSYLHVPCQLPLPACQHHVSKGPDGFMLAFTPAALHQGYQLQHSIT